MQTFAIKGNRLLQVQMYIDDEDDDRVPRRLMCAPSNRKHLRVANTPHETVVKRKTRAVRALSPSTSFASNTDHEGDFDAARYSCPASRARSTTGARTRYTRSSRRNIENEDNNNFDEDTVSSSGGGVRSSNVWLNYSGARLVVAPASTIIDTPPCTDLDGEPCDILTSEQQYCANCSTSLDAQLECSQSRNKYVDRLCRFSSSMRSEFFMMTSVVLIVGLAVVSHMISIGWYRHCKLEQRLNRVYNIPTADAFTESASCIDFPFKSILNAKFVLQRLPWLEDMSEATYVMLQPYPTLRISFVILAIIFAIAERAAVCWVVLRFSYGVVCRQFLRPLLRVVVTLSIVKFSFLSSKMFFGMMLSGKEGEKAWLSPSLAKSIVECLELGELPIDAMIGTVAALSSRAAQSVIGVAHMWLFSN